MKKSGENKTAKFYMNFEPSLLDAVKEAAYRARITAAEYIRQAARRELKRKPKKGRPGNEA